MRNNVSQDQEAQRNKQEDHKEKHRKVPLISKLLTTQDKILKSVRERGSYTWRKKIKIRGIFWTETLQARGPQRDISEVLK